MYHILAKRQYMI